MNDAVKDLREAQARGDFDMSPAALHGLLLHRRVVVEPAPRQVLQARLDERLRDKAHRTRNGATGWPWSVSDRWLQQEIDTLQGALAENTPASQRCEDCGDEVPKRTCYCRAGCVHATGPVSPSGGVLVEWEHLCSQRGEPVLTTKDRRCRFCGLAAEDDTPGGRNAV